MLRRLLYHIRASFTKAPADLVGGVSALELFATLRRLDRRRRSGGGAARTTILGHPFHAADRRSLLFLFEEMFLEQDYRTTLDGPAAGQPDPVIIDCGANVGMALLYFRMRWPEARVTAFEPDPDALAALRQTIAENGWEARLTLHPHAVAEVAGEVAFFGDPDRPAGVDGSTLEGRSEGTLLRTVTAVQLSEYITDRVDLLKIDIEGAEAGVLRELEASGTLPLVQQIIVEYHHRVGEQDQWKAFTALLDRNGFRVEVRSRRPAAAAAGTAQDLLLHCRRG